MLLVLLLFFSTKAYFDKRRQFGTIGCSELQSRGCGRMRDDRSYSLILSGKQTLHNTARRREGLLLFKDEPLNLLSARIITFDHFHRETDTSGIMSIHVPPPPPPAPQILLLRSVSQPALLPPSNVAIKPFHFPPVSAPPPPPTPSSIPAFSSVPLE